MIICDVVFNCISLSYWKLNSLVVSASELGLFRLFLLLMEQNNNKNLKAQYCEFCEREIGKLSTVMIELINGPSFFLFFQLL